MKTVYFNVLSPNHENSFEHHKMKINAEDRNSGHNCSKQVLYQHFYEGLRCICAAIVRNACDILFNVEIISICTASFLEFYLFCKNRVVVESRN